MKYNHWKANQINPFIFISKMPQIRKDGTKAPNHVVLVQVKVQLVVSPTPFLALFGKDTRRKQKNKSNQHTTFERTFSEAHSFPILFKSFAPKEKKMSSVSKSTVALPQRTRARVQREVIGLLKNSPEGIKLIVDPETGLPPSLNEITVRHALALFFNRTKSVLLHMCQISSKKELHKFMYRRFDRSEHLRQFWPTEYYIQMKRAACLYILIWTLLHLLILAFFYSY